MLVDAADASSKLTTVQATPICHVVHVIQLYGTVCCDALMLSDLLLLPAQHHAC